MEPKFLEITEENNCGIFKVQHGKYEIKKGVNAFRVKINAPNWVSAIVKIPNYNNPFVMVEQYRYGVGKSLKEFPCGMVEEGETALEAIFRECEEEIGLKQENITKVVKLYEHNPNPAFMTNGMTCFYIEEVLFHGRQR